LRLLPSGPHVAENMPGLSCVAADFAGQNPEGETAVSVARLGHEPEPAGPAEFAVMWNTGLGVELVAGVGPALDVTVFAAAVVAAAVEPAPFPSPQLELASPPVSVASSSFPSPWQPSLR